MYLPSCNLYMDTVYQVPTRVSYGDIAKIALAPPTVNLDINLGINLGIILYSEQLAIY